MSNNSKSNDCNHESDFNTNCKPKTQDKPSKHVKKYKLLRSTSITKLGKYNIFNSETLLSNNTANYGTIIDRFLPVLKSSPDTKLFHPSPAPTLENSNGDIDSIVLQNSNNVSVQTSFTGNTNDTNPIVMTNNGMQINNTWFVDSIQQDDISFGNSNDLSNTSNSIDSFFSSSNFQNLSDLQTKSHEKNVALALGFKSERIFTFKPLKSPKKIKQLHEDIDLINKLQITTNHESEEETNFNLHNEQFISVIPFKVLDAPGLRNDYYSNLVSWANKSGTIAAGLGSIVYCWSESMGTVPLQPLNGDLISALSYSSNDFLAVGTKESNICIYKPKFNHVVATLELKRKVKSSICSIKWIPNSNFFFVGNDIGEVSLLEVLQRDELKIKKVSKQSKSEVESKLVIKYSLKHKVTFRCDQQQICGIDVNKSGKQLAIGCNNNNSSIWDISDLNSPKKLFHLKHEAAVKAVAFCPWMPNLLATGGGSRDKNIRFWHSTSGTLISKHKTKGQITAVVWSRSKKEILVTFGFGDSADKNCILAVYSYPSMKLKIKVDGPSDMRVLNADLSSDFSSICTSISDQSVRIYNVWDTTFDLKSGVYDDGAYGSDIIDIEEGVNKSVGVIR
ncbi:hypothetical protein C6P40_005026 [Pichia californica]|uniref:CDC20/Fizzy WD40 domain-containing protein n=1 Tax=Pichia californica TaxID=460514 RepID=A0A9P6WPX9_9ASCO|nr:hypothetical protein C6P42_004013 [[Candida] californica]KAG0691107.1 hypothetical protein C6P40_005026 [[Candida] californica]